MSVNNGENLIITPFTGIHLAWSFMECLIRDDAKNVDLYNKNRHTSSLKKNNTSPGDSGTVKQTGTVKSPEEPGDEKPHAESANYGFLADNAEEMFKRMMDISSIKCGSLEITQKNSGKTATAAGTETTGETSFETGTTGRIPCNASSIDDKEKIYLNRAVQIMLSCTRSMNVLLRGRNRNWEQNENLRKVVMEDIEEANRIGFDVKNAAKTLPPLITSTLAGASAGSVVSAWLGKHDPLITIPTIFIFAALGYFVHFMIIKGGIPRKLDYLVRLDYENNLYYMSFLKECREVLANLYIDLQSNYFDVYGKYCADAIINIEHELSTRIIRTVDFEKKINENIGSIFKGLWTPHCRNVHRYMQTEGLIGFDRWAYCETSGDAKECSYPENHHCSKCCSVGDSFDSLGFIADIVKDK